MGTPSATTDKVFLLSATEVWGILQTDGTQYEYYQSKGVTTSSYSGASSSNPHWIRSVESDDSKSFRYVRANGDLRGNYAQNVYYVFPAWCF